MIRLREAVLKGIVEALLAFPVLLIVGLYLLDDRRVWYWFGALFSVYLLGVFIRYLFPRQRRYVYFLIILIVGNLPNLFFHGGIWLFLSLTLIQMLAVHRGLLHGGGSGNLPILFLYFGGFTVYFICYFLYLLMYLYQPYLELYTICGIVYIAITLFYSNIEKLKSSTLSKEKKPFINKSVRRQNISYMIGFFLFILLLAFIGRDWLWHILRAIILFIFRDSGRRLPPMPQEERPPLVDGFFDADYNTSLIADIIYLLIVVTIFTFILLLFFKNIRNAIINFIKRALSRLKEMVDYFLSHEETHGYVDEKESVFDWEEWKKEQQTKWKNFVGRFYVPKTPWDQLTNEEKVRHMYRRVAESKLRKGEVAKTPREILAEVTLERKGKQLLQDSYEDVRYGEKTIPEKTVENLEKLVGK